MTAARLPLIALLALTLPLTAAEQSIGEGTLDADQGALDLREGFYHFSGNVKFRYPGGMDLDCDDLRIRLIPGTDQIDRLIASNKVVMTFTEAASTNATSSIRSGATNRVYAALAVYSGTNDFVTLTGTPAFGQPSVERTEGSFKADVITFDRANDKLDAKGHFRMVIKPAALPKSATDLTRPASKP